MFQMCVNKAKNLTIIITTKTIILYREEERCIMMTKLRVGGRLAVGCGTQRERDKTHTSPIDIIMQLPFARFTTYVKRRLIN